MHWQTTRFSIDLARPKVMGIVNLTPDSFSDGGQIFGPAAAIARCEQLLAEGTDILDLGGESTRPGSRPVSLDEELARLMPVLKAVLTLGCPVSIDTNKTAVMAAVLDLGADIVNDINALQAPGAIDVLARHPSGGVCLMHMRGTPESMQQRPQYANVIDEVTAFLRERVAALTARGVDADRIAIDPGIGFGKSVEHNLDLLRRQRELLAIGRPLLVGWSRKSTLGAVTGRAVDERLAASVAAALAAVAAGARILRVHDVGATVDALKVWQAAGGAQG